MRFTIGEMLAKLPLPSNDKWKGGVWDIDAFEKNGVKLVFFSPSGIDFQTSHDEDEFYFIARGSGEVIIGGERFVASVGDAFFVAAKIPHRFENFSDDFATWAIFF
ncbi:MAG: cupin domain-containing protein [Pyrinomonadaceae bacterium]